MLGLYISIFIILANILFICAIYSCIKVRNKGLRNSYDFFCRYLQIRVIIICLQPASLMVLTLLSDLLLALCIQALPSCLADCNQENSPVSCKQHTGGRLHHPPPLHFLLC